MWRRFVMANNTQTNTQPIPHQTKTQAISAHLTRLARQLGPDARLPTMQELSRQLGVSVMTLNRALSELEAQGIIYRRQGSGTYVSSAPSTQTVALVYDRDIFSPSASPFCGLLVEEARRRARDEGEQFSFFLAAPDASGAVHADLAEAVRSRRLHGALFVGEANPAAVGWLEANIPTVALAYTPVAKYRVMIDHARGVAEGTRALLAQGCTNIALWIPQGAGIGRAHGGVSFPVLDAFRDALQTADLPFDEVRVPGLATLSDDASAAPDESYQEQGFRLAREAFAGENPPHGLVIVDDMMTRGALAAFARQGLVPDRDVKIATHTNAGTGALHGYEDALTRLEVEPAELVNALFSQLETLLRGDEPAQSVVAVAPHLRLPSG